MHEPGREIFGVAGNGQVNSFSYIQVTVSYLTGRLPLVLRLGCPFLIFP